ncbi:MAG: CoA pyrophosphatase [Candidatus Lokiarchaeota archaeon]|nr:CoA pyrophosphatase [Candidatus Lokiarchaeota archaeon]
MDSANLIFNENSLKKKIYPCDSSSRTSLNDSFFTKAAVLFSIIPHVNKPYELILIHRSNMGTRHRGEISFPGGKFEPGEDKTLKDTALRETEEEIGVSRNHIRIIGCLNDFPTISKFIVTPFLGLINKNQELIREEREVQKILKVPIDFFINKINFSEQEFSVADDKFPVFYYNYFNEENEQTYTIWGATAFLITHFLELVYNVQIGSRKAKRPSLDDIIRRHQYLNQ